MSEAKDFQHLLHSIHQQTWHILQNYQPEPDKYAFWLSEWIDVLKDFDCLTIQLFNYPEKIWEMHTAYWRDTNGLLQEQWFYWLQGKFMPIEDKRFSSLEWVDNPFFNLLSQHYLLASEHLISLIEHIPFKDKHLRKRINFYIKQYVDALSPANFISTNPEIIAQTLQTHGKNLLQGLQQLLTDLEGGPSRLISKMTDQHAFTVGKNIAVTPGKVVFRNDLMELIQYTPTTAMVYSRPLLIIPPWINKYYILDLSPHNSLIAWLVKQGITVFCISWKNPHEESAEKGLANYLEEGPLAAIAIIQQQLQVKTVNTLGFCIGGTLQACLLAYCKAKKLAWVHSATFLASLIDFSDPGDIAVFIDKPQVEKLEKRMQKKGYLAGPMMANTFNSLRANDLIWSFFIRNYLQGKAPVPFDILFWNSDTTNMPATMHSQYLRWMYLNNSLIVPNKISLNGVPLDISQIDIPTFFVSTIKDHIAPWKTVYKGYHLLKGKKRFLLGGSGHIAGIINPPDNHKYDYYYSLTNYAHAEKWLEHASYYKGSWWERWGKWLEKHSRKLVPAPVFNDLPYPGIANAPGKYVLEQA